MALQATGRAAALPASDAGAIPGTDTVVVTSVGFAGVETGTGNGNAPVVTVTVDIDPAILFRIDSVQVTLRGPDGSLTTERKDSDEDFETFELELRARAISGEYEIAEIRIDFSGDPAVTGLPQEGLVLTADAISSLTDSRFIDLINPDEDVTPPIISDIELPTRSILVDNDLPDILGGGLSAEITFNATISDEESGLNIIEFEFDIGPGSPAVIGAAVGLFGDLRNGERELSTFNTEAPAGKYIFELLRVSDDQGNTVLLTADDLAGLGYQNSVQIVSQDDLQDAESPTVSAFALADNSVTIDAEGATLQVSLTATDDGFGATGVQTVTLVLVSDLGSRYQLDADVVFSDGDNATAEFIFPPDFPAGSFTISRVSVNDAAFNRKDVALADTAFTVVNPSGGDIADNRLRGDAGDNLIIARAGDDTVVGADGNDSVRLGSGDDVSFAGAGDTGNDTIVGGSGDDLIGGGAGDDFIVGGRLLEVDVQTLLQTDLEPRLDGADTIFGGDGDDSIIGGSPFFGSNDLDKKVFSDYGSIAADQIYAGRGDDFVRASYGDDTIGGGAGSDTLWAGAGDDTIYGGAGDAGAVGINDRIEGQTGNDVVFASGGDDVVNGGADNDTLFGGAGADTVDGDGGHDAVYGGAGDDVLFGGTGEDTFFFAPGSGADVIEDFNVADDTLFLSAYSARFDSAADILAGAVVFNLNGDFGLLIGLGQGDQIFLEGVTSLAGLKVVF